ncbi:vascular endothelial growth factor receptor 1-like isoform X2 [Leptopilina boulardi]|uniref:vascular endothelial growth factor receptor 1-like isoform X2 n=1 Tax=Leptopilina boulardi TaxID=63433 RepID=UPI0021F5AC0A|nr:vascular endothelial growth factor receptor 1-like isoform X2 [Leptopilina boulardi]
MFSPWILYGSLAFKPILEPSSKEIIINEGDLLELNCTSGTPLIFVYPHELLSIDTSDAILSTIIDDDGNFIINFRRLSAISGDTGWYGCAEEDVGFPSKQDMGFHANFSWIYVYVKSDEQLLVADLDLEVLHATSGYDEIIPCRPTSPYFNVTISILGDSIYEKIQSTFNPKIGFVLKNPQVIDSNQYECTATREDGFTQSIDVYLMVTTPPLIEDLKITPVRPRYVIEGQNLSINCTATITKGGPFTVRWFGPPNRTLIQNDPRRPVKNYTSHLEQFWKYTVELNILNSTHADNGIYYCETKTNGPKEEAQTFIEIHDPRITFIDVDSDDHYRYHVLNETEHVRWIVHIYAHPPPTIRWMSSLGKSELQPVDDRLHPEYNITVDPELTMTTFSIRNLRLAHSGNYTLEVSNEHGNRSITFSLYVRMKPRNNIKVHAYYAPNQLVEIRNEIDAYPATNVTWSYLNCPHYPSQHSCFVENMLEWSLTEESPIRFETIVKFQVKMSGVITCLACNEVGCEMAHEVVLVSDGNNGVGIIIPEGQMTVGDDLELICFASIYNYTNNLRWQIDEQDVVENDRIKLIKEKTQFTHRSILSIKNLQKSDAMEYACVATANDFNELKEYYILNLADPIPAKIIETNMNGTEVTFDLNTLGHNMISLTCGAIGTPKPNITWYKDGNLLERNNQYFFTRSKQELNIKYLDEGDSGKYLCRAENRFAKEERFLTFIVVGKELPKTWIIAGCTVLIICCLLTVIYCIKFRRERVMRKQLMEAGLTHFEEGALECLNPDLTLDDQAEHLPYDRKWEFPREKLELGKQLGSGAFGVVRKARAKGILENEEVTTVAVKMVKRTIDPTYIKALASELKIMVHLGKHLNVVNLLGACTKNISKSELLVIVEYCHFGNLHNYLLRHRGDFIDQIDPTTGKLDINIGQDILSETNNYDDVNRVKYAALSFSPSHSYNSDNTRPGVESVTYTQDSVTLGTGEFSMSNTSSQPDWRTNYRGDYKDKNLRPICTQDLTSWAFQVARGMEYLSERKVLHGDLAARNILLAENNIVKICDFGLAKTMYKDNNYKKKGDALLPIKWMAIESIRDRVFSTQSDVWSFGIVLWEFFTLAQTPYYSIDAETQYHKLIEGYRLEQPEYATREMYDIILQCWTVRPILRPSFSELVNLIGDLLGESVKQHYMDLNTPYMDMNTMALEGKNDYLKMMSAPDHTLLSSPSHDYVNAPSIESTGRGDSAYLSLSPSGKDDTMINSPGPDFNHTHFRFPTPVNNKSANDSDPDEIVESSPMLQEDDDPYLKPINIHEQRARFVKEQQSKRRKPVEIPDPNLGYCNTSNINSLDNKKDTVDYTEKKNGSSVPSIIRTQDNYVNMPKQKSDLRKDLPPGTSVQSFSNPSYIFMDQKDNDEVDV